MTLDLPAVPSPDLAAAAAAAARRDRLPAGALGVWGAVLDTLAAARGMASGSLAPQRPRLVVMAADHGVADLGVSAAVPTGMEPVDATTRGSGVDDAAWITKAAAVRDALFRVRKAGSDVLTLLRTGGGADLAALTGFITQAAIRRTPVLIHDLPSTVCGVLAHRLAPGADSYLLASSLSPERGHRRLLEVLGREPLTDWSITAGSGVAALLVVPSLRAAAQAVDAVLAVDEAAGSPERVTRSAHAIDAWDPELL